MAECLSSVRELMQLHGIDGYFLPHNDYHSV